jgi:hypothetical protein
MHAALGGGSPSKPASGLPCDHVAAEVTEIGATIDRRRSPYSGLKNQSMVASPIVVLSANPVSEQVGMSRDKLRARLSEFGL